MDFTKMQPNYESMYLSDLKLIAKTRRIKLYYVKTKEELIKLLTLPELPIEMKIEKMTIHQLRDEAKKRGIVGFWELRRPALVELLFPKDEIAQTPPYENQQNESQTNKHHQPEKHDAKDIGIKNV
jgi:hypothetical protein